MHEYIKALKIQEILKEQNLWDEYKDILLLDFTNANLLTISIEGVRCKVDHNWLTKVLTETNDI